jgi:serine/threonine protein kinase
MTQERPNNARADSKIDTALMSKTAPGVVMGTVAYMSPEQARGETVDERTDIWSLGVVLYEMVAGCSPFVAARSNEIISAILSKTPAPALVRFVHDMPPRLEEIVEKALTKNKDERYQTSKDLLIDLKRLQQTLQLKDVSERSTSPDRVAITSMIYYRMEFLVGTAAFSGAAGPLCRTCVVCSSP